MFPVRPSAKTSILKPWGSFIPGTFGLVTRVSSVLLLLVVCAGSGVGESVEVEALGVIVACKGVSAGFCGR